MYKNLYGLSLSLVGIIALGLGFWGFHECGVDCKTSTFSNQLIATLNLIRGYGNYATENAPVQLLIAQYALPAVAVLAGIKLFFVGARRDLRVAMARRKLNHTIVCGLGDAGMQLVQSLRDARQDVVAIDRNSTAPHVLTCESQGIAVLAGDAKNPSVMRFAGLRRARAVVVCTGVDAENMDIALRLKKQAGRYRRFLGRRLTAHVELRSDWLLTKLANLGTTPLGSAEVELRLFSTHANAARILIESLRLPPARDIAPDTFVIVGLGPTGREVAQQIVRAAPVALGRMTKLIVLDAHAEDARQKFIDSFPAATEFADLQFVTADLSADTSSLWKAVEDKLRPEALIGVAVCLPDDKASFYVALEMRSVLDRLGHLHVPVFVRLEHQRRLGEFAGDLEGLAQFRDRLRVFGALEELFGPEVFFAGKLDALAQALHEDFRASSAGAAGSEAGRPWHDLPEFMKMSNRWRADHTPIMLALAGLRMEHVASPVPIELTPEEIAALAKLEHRRYRIERRMLGWQYGEVRDTFSRRHPDLTDWDKLSPGSRDYNLKMVATLPKVLAGIGIEIRREQVIRAYGASLGGAAAEIERAAADADRSHKVVIADIDTPEGRAAAAKAPSLSPSSLWLISRGIPKELYQLGAQAASPGLPDALRQAEGWVRSDRVGVAPPQ